ncbi:ArsR/SmtB family transcription factor [Evansella tamaricis]|uniref:Metalloregulator ArsR/SmtB family transcription factor n=1 Tax=Evansella tamaricis TaxID=2069301 RepID=A0ABS6JFW6_9BACI|nr:metalloregulator ArsR/SmtB family transcription factor [Evansella tamaricis]MBU9712542.1 metalloregulator ArsR/SmtB family transcription factor [Evansella tamaricis]
MNPLSIPLTKGNTDRPDAEFFHSYEKKFKALADKKRLEILYLITNSTSVCVCDLSETIDMQQSKLSYHLKILLDANLITKETKGTWSYYQINQKEMNGLLSNQLCCIFRTEDSTCC